MAHSRTQRPDASADTLIIGGGVAGFRAAVEAARVGSVIVVTKDAVRESSTQYAQGGVAAVLGEDDTLALHREDTLQAGQGLCEGPAVATVVSEGPERIRELIEWGGAFDHEGDRLHLGREGGHSRHRIVHAHGDATGKEVVATLLRRVRSEPRIQLWEFSFARDLVMHEGRCAGAQVLRRGGAAPLLVAARNTILCTGGAGHVWRETTNPEIATGDGIAMAWRAGAQVGDMEFVQFHPTTLYIAGAARHLITEAVRGEGGRLVDGKGDRFVFRFHPSGELAPRDIVSRAIVQQLAVSGEQCVWLDLTHLGEAARERFPGINRTCALYGLDITRDLIPVHPSAHYMVGGVVADAEGRTSLPGLYAAGEAAMSGLHGANRLASNSLLEGLVFGRRAGMHASSTGGPLHAELVLSEEERPLPAEILHLADMRNSIRSLMWRSAGILRRGDQLRAAHERLTAWSDYAGRVQLEDPPGLELRNMLAVASLVTRAALWREESRGTHYRTDFPERDDARFRVHSIQTRGGTIVGRPIG